MKIKFLSAVLVLGLFFCNIAIAAPRHSTPEEIEYALNQSVRSLRNTDDFYTSWKGDYESLIRNLEKCRAEYKVLHTISFSGTVGGKEAGACLLNAMIIMQERELALSNIKRAFQAVADHNYKDKEKYKRIADKYLKKAKDSRQKFKIDYGY